MGNTNACPEGFYAMTRQQCERTERFSSNFASPHLPPGCIELGSSSVHWNLDPDGVSNGNARPICNLEYRRVHSGRCAAGGMSGNRNRRVANLLDCGVACLSHYGCWFFAYNHEEAPGSNCALYTYTESSCPRHPTSTLSWTAYALG